MKNAVMFFTVLAVATTAFAVEREEQPLAVNAASTGGGTPPPSGGMATRSTEELVTLRIYNSCFGTNLRSVANPIAPSSIITSTLTLTIGADAYNMKLVYPAKLVATSEPVDPAAQPLMDGTVLPDKVQASYYGNVVQVRIPRTKVVTAETTGEVTSSPQETPRLSGMSFSQEATCGDSSTCGQYMAHSGPLNAAISGFAVSSDNGNIEVQAAFPGQNGFCGGYFSPLMLFFDDGRPMFSQISSFKLHALGRTHWPERGSAGYFLAIDRNRNGKIDDGRELFGDGSKPNWNGFKELALLDTNKDGKITKADKEFANLRLWKDKNADGISQKSELLPLAKMKVTEISLKYKDRDVRTIANNAEEREHSTFTYVKNGKRKTGKIIDVWLAPVLDSLADK